MGSSVVLEVDDSLVSVGDFSAPAVTDTVGFLVAQYRAEKKKIEEMSAYITQNESGVLKYFLEATLEKGSSLYVDCLFNKEAAIAVLDATYWNRLLNMTDLFEIMPSARRDEWSDQITKHTTPAFAEQTVRDTLFDLISRRKTFLSEKVDAIFRSLSGSHVTNRPEGFSKRMIIDQVIYQTGYLDYTKAGPLNDLRSVIAKFMGRDQPHHTTTNRAIEIARDRGGWVVLDGGALRLRVFKGACTAHLEVNEAIAWKLNQVLSYLYPAAIPSSMRTKPKRVTKSFATLNTPIPFTVVKVFTDILHEKISDNSVTIPYMLAKESETLSRVKTILQSIGGTSVVHNKYDFNFDPRPVIEEIALSGQVPEQKSHQFHPTREALGSEAVARAGIEDGDECLEPSAGMGGLADHMPKDQTLCIEISKLHCKVLTAKGYNTECGDFLAWACKTSRRFDRIVMNPPFSDGRATLHLEAAASLLRANGRLVAILPGSMRGKDLLPGFSHEWHGPYTDQFDGTGVVVTMLVAQRS